MTTADLARSILPDEKAIAAAIESSRQIAAFVSTTLDTQRIELVDEAQQRQTVELPTFALRLLGDILNELALGNTVKVVPIHAELTTQKGADMLNVSRLHLVKLLDEGQIPHTRTGSHCCIKFTDLIKPIVTEQVRPPWKNWLRKPKRLTWGTDEAINVHGYP